MIKNNHIDVLLEDVNSKFDTIIELVRPLPDAITQLQHDVKNINTDASVMKAVVRDHSKTLQSHEHRLVKLEST